MPFTPFHMGPGLAIKAFLQSSFSLMIFGWTQIVMDLQPLIVILTGRGHLHGFTHTYLGAIFIACFSALTGKYLSEFYIRFVHKKYIHISWPVSLITASIGSFSHVFLDSIMHHDLQPFFPFTHHNMFLGLCSISFLHQFCIYSGLIAGSIFFILNKNLTKY